MPLRDRYARRPYRDAMFTGLIQSMGVVVERIEVEAGQRLRVTCPSSMPRPQHGESIAVDGCCLTVVGVDDADETPSVSGEEVGRKQTLSFDVIPQTLRMTTLGELRVGRRVNLERSVTPHSLLGGHIVQGHVDGVGLIKHVSDRANDYLVQIEPPPELMEFIMPQGAIAVAGVSLTIASEQNSSFNVALIPATLALTNLGERRAGDRVNLEVDCIAKMVMHWLRRQERARASS